MTVWADSAAALIDARRFLHDGPKDHLVKSKKVLGPVDGANKTFFVLEERLITEELGSPIADGIQVTVNYEPPEGVVAIDDALLGQFSFTIPPPESADIRAAYAFQYWLDEELLSAFKEASTQINGSEEYLLLDGAFKGPALRFVASFALAKQSIRWIERLSTMYLLQEEPTSAEVLGRSQLFQTTSDKMYAQAIKMRDDIYLRQGRRQAPGFAVYRPRWPIIGTNR